MNAQFDHADDDAIALLARALTPISAAALAHAANQAPAQASVAAATPGDELPRAA